MLHSGRELAMVCALTDEAKMRPVRMKRSECYGLAICRARWSADQDAPLVVSIKALASVVFGIRNPKGRRSGALPNESRSICGCMSCQLIGCPDSRSSPPRIRHE
jgi:hypothetical protein